MVKDYYQVLGLPAGANQNEIKRAYFKLVRQFSPERDPERFQEIREAYEKLKSQEADQEEQKKFTLEFPDTKIAEQMKEQIERGFRYKDYKLARMTAEEALNFWGESQGFLYFLGKAQRLEGKTGKAAKTFERLVEMYPERGDFVGQLAVSYLERGYGKKAYEAFRKAYDMGLRNNEFLLLYSHSCMDREDFGMAVKLLEEVAKQAGKNTREYMEELLNAYTGIFSMGSHLTSETVKKELESLVELFKLEGSRLAEYEEELQEMFYYMMRAVIQSEYVLGNPGETLLGEIRRLAKGFLDGRLFQNVWDDFQIALEGQRIDNDGRMPDVLKRGQEAFFLSDLDSRIASFMKLDTKLCILEEWPGIQEKLEIVKKEYPVFYTYLEEFVHTLENSDNLDHLRSRLQKDYDRLESMMSGGFYYKEYPHRRRPTGSVSWDSEKAGTFVRGQKKIGRNDPCPCGSGKKYKNCCGRG